MYCIVATMRGHTQSILTLDILLEGKYIVTYGIQGEICVWDASTYTMLDGTYMFIFITPTITMFPLISLESPSFLTPFHSPPSHSSLTLILISHSYYNVTNRGE